MHYARWSEDEISYIKENFGKIKTEDIAVKLSRTKYSVRNMYFKLGLQKQLPKVGDVFNRLTIKEMYSENVGNQQKTKALCECICGKETKVRVTDLVNNHVLSCGCLLYKHGLMKHPVYTTWKSMTQRCYNENDSGYKNYGAKGITVCDEWRKDFLVFYNWAIENGYQSGLSLDRIIVTEGYCPENCRWATREVQANNTSRNVFITAFGETKTVAQWTRDERCKTNAFNINYRLSKGYTPEEAITTETRGCKKNKVVQYKKRVSKNININGMANHPLCSCWYGMKSRCYDENNLSYKNYGGRGITVCEDWKYDFKSFYDWCMATNYSPGLSLERINNDGNYEPGNCTWIPKNRQSSNKRNSHFVEAFGEIKTLADWMRDERCKSPSTVTIVNRIKAGWTNEKAIMTPKLH